MKNALIIHHNDNDGYASAGIVSYYLVRVKKYTGSIDYLEADYVQPLDELIKSYGYCIDNYDSIYLLDYSISTYENIKFVLELNSNENINIVWIDHHKSSIESIDNYPQLKDIEGFRIIGISATLLCWCKYLSDNRVDLIKSIFNKILDTHSTISTDETDKIISETHVPKCIAAIHYYDIWDHRNPDTTNFKLGYTLNNPESIWGIIQSSYLDYTTYRGSVEDGRVISRYVDEQNKEYCAKAALDMNISYNGRLYSVMALNTNRCTSLTFGDNMDKYDICMPFWYNGKKHIWSYSLYTNKDDVDCSEIAKTLGGGGHKQAAGFTMKTCICDLKDKILTI